MPPTQFFLLSFCCSVDVLVELHDGPSIDPREEARALSMKMDADRRAKAEKVHDTQPPAQSVLLTKWHKLTRGHVYGSVKILPRQPYTASEGPRQTEEKREGSGAGCCWCRSSFPSRKTEATQRRQVGPVAYKSKPISRQGPQWRRAPSSTPISTRKCCPFPLCTADYHSTNLSLQNHLAKKSPTSCVCRFHLFSRYSTLTTRLRIRIAIAPILERTLRLRRTTVKTRSLSGQETRTTALDRRKRRVLRQSTISVC